MHFLITGGAGFIGSNITRRLVAEGYNVRILDNFATGRRENIADLIDKIDLIEGDIRDITTVKISVKEIDYILHQAASPSVMRSIIDPISTNNVNINGTLNILIAARDEGVKRVVYASSSSVYGDTPTLPKNEDMEKNPLSPYAITKLVGEYYCKVFLNLYGVETVSLRYFNIFGPRQDPNSQYAAVIPIFINALIKNTPPPIFGDGEQSRDFTYVDNAVRANIDACFAKDVGGEVFNIACSESFTLNHLLDQLKKIMNKEVKPNYLSPRKGDIRHSLADISKGKRLLGYNPDVHFHEGLKRTVEWYMSAQNL
ncbi:MAG: SDR family oxidoreductase [Nitrospinae bacterium]|nr:SDR family oxidoreductase [Nitrospinota bacterium]